MRRKIEKRTWQTTEAPTMAVRFALKQPEDKCLEEPGEKGWTCYYCGKEGHPKRDCPQASKPPPAPCPVYKGLNSFWTLVVSLCSLKSLICFPPNPLP